jgi:hypothetical protein
MLRALIITGMLLAAIGGGSLYWCKMQARHFEAESDRLEAKHAGQTQEFIRKVNEQVAKGDKAKLDFTWLKDGKSPQQRQQEQHERLLADIDRLAAGAEPLYADILYGSSWHDEVEKYKTTVYQRDLIQIGSVALLIAGGLLMSLGLLLVVVAAIRNMWAQGNTEGKNKEKEETADKLKAEMKTVFADFAGNLEARQKQFLTDLSGNAATGAPISSDTLTARFDESLTRFGKGLQNRLEGLISRIESSYNAGSKRNDEMLTHMNAMLKEQSNALEKITAEIETVAGSFMHEFAKQGKGMDERVSKSFREHAEQLAKETEAMKKLVKDMEKSLVHKPVSIREEMDGALAEFREGLARDMAPASSGDNTELRELIEKVEAVMAVGPSGSNKSELEQMLHEFREGITLDLASLTCKDTETLKSLIEKVEVAVTRTPAGDTTADLQEVAAELRQRLADDIRNAVSAHSEAVRELAAKVDAASSGKPSVDTEGFESVVCELKESLIAEITAMRAVLAQTGINEDAGADRLNELIDAVRNRDAAMAQAADKILSRIEELSSSQAVAGQDIISSSDTAFGDESLARLGDETSSTKEIATTTLSKAESIEKNLEEACRQIWAIREYAAKQQERMERLQDGYDWNIIGNFCLRVIRCVDNLEDRLAELAVAGCDSSHLQALRDELLFAMESSGVERFEVDPGSDFRGQEHRLKAQTQREVTRDPQLIGKVALVVRPGYQCYISEDITKTVRPAEVRVYGETSVEEPAIGGPCK